MRGIESVRVQSQIDRRTCNRVKPMKVLVLGLCRTGTLSTWLALQELGYDTYHMTSIMQNPQDAIMWKEAFLGKYYGGKKFRKTDWDQLLGHVEAITDFPGAVFVEELVEAYPDAKVVLTLRDVDDWYRSMQRTIMKQAYSPMATIMGWIDPVCFGEGNRMCRLGFDAMFKGDFDRNGKQAFLDHYNHVRRVVPAENLLEWSPSEGWGPLCTFLEQPIPPTPFPRSNEAVVFQQKSATVIWDSFGRFFMKVTTFGLGIAAAFFAAKYAHSLILP